MLAIHGDDVHCLRDSSACCNDYICICILSFYSEVKALVPNASDKLGESLIVYPRASSPMEVTKETKFVTKLAYEMRMMPDFRYTHSAERACDATLDNGNNPLCDVRCSDGTL